MGRLVSDVPRFDILILAAGTIERAPAIDHADDLWDRVIDVNLTAAFKLSREVLKEMLRRRWGRIVNITSIVGVTGNAGQANYAASKAGLIGMTKSMAAELAPKKIRVCAINPVIGETGLLSEFMGTADTPENRARFIATIPLGRMSLPADIANAALFLPSPESSMITGVALEVDGGRCV